MYELIEKIIAKAKEEKVTVDVAYDMLVVENGLDKDLKKAWEFFQKYEYEIQSIRKVGRSLDARIICSEADNKEFVRKHVNALYNEGVIER